MRRLWRLWVSALALVASTAATSASPLQCPLPSGQGPTTELDATIVGTQGYTLFGDAFFGDPGAFDVCNGQQGFDLSATCEVNNQMEGDLAPEG